MSIFQKSVVNKYLKTIDEQKLEQAYERFSNFYGNKLRLMNIVTLKEENYQEGFLREIFVNVLGYTINPDLNYNITTEYKNKTDNKKADGAILKDGQAIAVIELKSTKTAFIESITNQAFNYKNNQPNCRYVITSNFHYLRFFIDNATEFEEFDLFELSKDEFKRLYLFLCCKSIIEDIPLKLKEETKFHEESISDKFYNDYRSYKENIYNSLIKNNSQYDKVILYKKSQKILDRLLFILFAEDTGLIPPNAIARTIEKWKGMINEGLQISLYSRFQSLFSHLNKGFVYPNWGEIPAYNGGLFQSDEILDNPELIIENNFLETDSLKLASYDFNSEIDVNILGHIFEHSLNEFEEISAQIQGEKIDKTKTKRKKDGVFYTPKYVTKYIVEKTIGFYCALKKEKLGLNLLGFENLTGFRNKNEKFTKEGKALFEKFTEYKNWLFNLKIIDPACGSGAFLIEALHFLINEHKEIDDKISELENKPIRFFDTDKAILEKNIYGVDINEESVEIAKLSLWLNTAKKERKLSDLNGNIKCGNSLIDNKEIAGGKAFDWNSEFPEIMQSGGFDIIIGNPPWVSLIGKHGHNTLNEVAQKWLINHYGSNTYLPNLFEIFIIRSLTLLKQNGFFSFIVPDRFGYNASFNYLRENVLQNYKLIEIIYKWDFPGIITDTMTFVIQNIKQTDYSITIKSEPQNGFINFTKQQILSKQDFQFKAYKSQTAKYLIDRMINNSLRLNEICQITSGFGGKSDLITAEQINTKQIPVYKGSSIQRYEIKENYWFEFIPENITGRTTDKTKLSASPKILLRKTGNTIIANYDESGIFPEQSLYFIYNVQSNFNFKYLLAILNSDLITWFFVNNLVTNLDSTPQIKLVDLEQIPIVNISIENQKPFIDYVDIILQSKQTIKKSEKFTNQIKNHLKIKTITQKLAEFYKYDFKTFIEELGKQKVKLSLKQSEEWEEYFNTYIYDLKTANKLITETNEKLNNLINSLFNLSNEEIDLIQNINN